MNYKIIPERDLIWAAGLIDGEGSIYVKKYSGGKNVNHSLEIEIGMTDKPTMEKLYNIFNIGSFRPAKRKNKIDYHKQAWKVVYSSKQAEQVIRLLLPYFVTKQNEAKMALKFLKTKQSHPGRKGLSKEIISIREQFYNDMKSLKKIDYPVEEHEEVTV